LFLTTEYTEGTELEREKERLPARHDGNEMKTGGSYSGLSRRRVVVNAHYLCSPEEGRHKKTHETDPILIKREAWLPMLGGVVTIYVFARYHVE